MFLLPPKILCIASLRKLFLAAAGAKQDGQKSGFILFAFLRYSKEPGLQVFLLKRFVLLMTLTLETPHNTCATALMMNVTPTLVSGAAPITTLRNVGLARN
ncbi:MAG: hypothetical protein ACJAX1_001769 [Neolewinella sp.]